MSGRYFLWVVFGLFFIAFVSGLASETVIGLVLGLVALVLDFVVYRMIMREDGKVRVQEVIEL